MPGLSQDPEKREKQLGNLLDPSEAGKLGGRPKGSKNWSSVVKELLDDEDLFEQLLESMERKPSWLAKTNTKTLMQAITIAQSLKALSGSHFSAEWVRKTGYGDKIDLTSNGETIKIEPIIVSTIKARQTIVEGEIVEPAAIETSQEEADESATSA